MRKRLILSVLLVGLGVLQVYGQNSSNILSFADELFNREDYFRAITEYKRFIFFHPEHLQVPHAEFRIAESFFQAGKAEDAALLFQDLADEYRETALGRRSIRRLSRCYVENNEYALAAFSLQQLMKIEPSVEKKHEALLELAWCHTQLGETRLALDRLEAFPSESPMKGIAVRMRDEVEEYRNLPEKSPWVAGGLSAVLPGAGQLYVGRLKDAGISFVLNAAFAWAAWEAFEEDLLFTGSALTLFEVSWYAGNIYSAVGGAHKYNRNTKQDFLESTRVEYGLFISRAADPEDTPNTGFAVKTVFSF